MAHASSPPRDRSSADLAPHLAAIPRLRQRLLTWYRLHRRDLPWRDDRDPYRIWIAEVMLQQTRVEVVVPYFERFMGRFPDVASLARAPLASVLQAWAGLGYYARARALHATARAVMRQHGGSFKRAAGSLESLPGIGRYTAGAVRSIAFDMPAPIVDGNVARVFARLFALDEPGRAATGRARLWELAAAWADGPAPGDANQALMELGALVCAKPVPQCVRCPIQSSCAAWRTGRVHELPAPRRAGHAARLALSSALVQRAGRLFLVRRRGGRLLRDWWELPACTAVEGARPAHPRRRLAAVLRQRCGFTLQGAQPVATLEHGIQSYRLVVTVLACQARRTSGGPSRDAERTASPVRRARRPAPGAGPGPAGPPADRRPAIASLEWKDLESCWADAAACRRLPLSTLTRKALGAAAVHDARWRDYLPVGSGPLSPAARRATRSPGRSARRSSRRGT